MELTYRSPMAVQRRRNRIHRRLRTKYVNRTPIENEIALNKAMKNSPKSVLMRSKRSVQKKDAAEKKNVAVNHQLNNKKNVFANKNTQIDDLYKFNQEDDSSNYSSEEEETTTRRPSSRRGSAQLMQEEDQNKQLKFINSQDYRDYAFDTNNNELFNEDDDLLRRYYSKPVNRRSTSDYGSFTDLMHVSANENENGDGFVRRLHYGDNFLENDIGEQANDEYDDEYNNYDDDY